MGSESRAPKRRLLPISLLHTSRNAMKIILQLFRPSILAHMHNPLLRILVDLAKSDRYASVYCFLEAEQAITHDVCTVEKIRYECRQSRSCYRRTLQQALPTN